MNRLKPLNKKFENKINSMAPILSTMQLKHLSEHKYTSQGISLLDPLFQPYWRYVVDQLPMNIAPNLITITGLLVNIVTSVLMILYSPNGVDHIPPWVLILCAIGLFLYQTLDAIDGKQARRTNSSTPLGELFDHGCDAISTIFVAISLCLSIRIVVEGPWYMFSMCLFAMSAFYVAHWQTYVTGTLRFGKADCTEAQVCIYMCYMATAIFGGEFWESRIPMIGMKIRFVPFLITVCGSTVSIMTHLVTISKGGIGKNGASVANTSIIFPHIPLTLVFILQFMIARKSVDGIFEKNTCLYILAFGIVWAKTTIRLIVAHMTKGEIYLTDSCLIGPLLLLMNQYFNFILPEYYVLWTCLVYNIYDLSAYCSKVCLEICVHLHIYLFKIGKSTSTTTTQVQANNQNLSTTTTTPTQDSKIGQKKL